MATTTRKRKRAFDPLDHKSHRDVLAMVGRYHYVTVRQVNRLLYGFDYLQYARKILKELTDAKLLTDANFIPKQVKSPGWPESVWSLTRKGHSALQQLSLPSGDHDKYGVKRGELFMLHTQLVNDTLIAGELFAKASPQVVLTGFQHEHSLKRLNMKLPGGSTLTPDGWQHFTIGQRSGAILYEVDRGTEDISAFKRKIANYYDFLSQGIYQHYLGDHDVQVLVLVRTVPSHRVKTSAERANDLVEYIAEVFTNKSDWADLFNVAIADPAQTDPVAFFTHPHTYSPFSDTPRALISLPEGT